MMANHAITLADLRAQDVGVRLIGDGDVIVSGVHHDSRATEAGDLFVAIAGEHHDGADHAEGAVERGAVAVLAERQLSLKVPLLVSKNARRDLATASEIIFGRPTKALTTVGITGTNGKTTVAHLLEDAIAGAGHAPALMGTAGCRIAGETVPAAHTTPEGDDISRFAKRALQSRCTHLLMEVSSHGLAFHRVDAVNFAVAAFTNLTQDHLDFHGTLEEYGAAKVRLFTELQPRMCVVNIDDSFGEELAARLGVKVIRCSTRPNSDAVVRVRSKSFDETGVVASFETPSGRFEVRSPLVGAHNLENLAVTLGCAEALQLPMDKVVDALALSTGSPGRLERVTAQESFGVFVDYAHTPDALTRVLEALRPLTGARLIVVFGAGGDRDVTKRGPMGEAAVRGADVVVITSDNPRSEAPERIVQAIEQGAHGAGGVRIEADALASATEGVLTVLDRHDAIHCAIAAAREGDIVLIAGKGHETTQTVGATVIPFDDRDQARAALAARAGRA